MFEITIQAGGGKTERKEGPTNWEKAHYLGYGEYLLYTNMSGAVSLHNCVLASIYEDYEENTHPDAFEIKRNGDFEIVINGFEIFNGSNQESVTELQEDVFLRRHMSKRILFLKENANFVELQIINTKSEKKFEVARVRFTRITEEEETKLISELEVVIDKNNPQEKIPGNPKPPTKEKNKKFKIPIISTKRLNHVFSEERHNIIKMSASLKSRKIPRNTVIDRLLLGSAKDSINFGKNSLNAEHIKKIFIIKSLGRRMTNKETIQFINSYIWPIWNYFYPSNRMDLVENMDEVVAKTRTDSVNLIYLLIQSFEKEGLKDIGLTFTKR